MADQVNRSTILFIDDGGVLNDNKRRRPEWLRLIGEYMPARLGGTTEQWASANRVVFSQVWGDIEKQLPDFASHQEFVRTYAIKWMDAMCAHVNIKCLPDDDAVALHTELSCYVWERANSQIAGATDGVRTLHRAGYTLYIASGGASWELRRIMTKMGIAECFTGIYGADIVDQVKNGPAYYRKLFGHAGVEPSRALIIDSDLECCQWASEAGARALWVDPQGRGDAPTLEELVPALIKAR